MNTPFLIRRLERGRDALSALLTGLTADEVSWKPAPDAWSILEVTGHLADEEVLDFRTRVEYTLHRPGEAWPPIDPVGWVTEKNYAGQDFETTLRRFLDERGKSLAWLAKLEDPDWELAFQHPKAGPIKAGDVALSWAAHDLLHIRQIDRLVYLKLEADGKPYSPEYAGGWSVR